jgi:predicted ester cyclase
MKGEIMDSEVNKQVIRKLAKAINSGNFEDLNNVLAPDYIRHDPNPLLKDAGREEYKQAFARLRRAFPDAEWKIDELLADGDRIVGRWTFHGTQTGQFFNIAPTGKEVTYPILAIYRIQDQMIAEDWHIFQSLALWQTLIPEIKDLIEKATAQQ